MDNFYEYCNKEWKEHTLIPSYRAAYGVSEEIENDIKDTFVSLIKKLPSSNPLSILWTSAYNREDPSNVTAVKSLFHRIASLSTIELIGRGIGFLNRWQLRSPLTFLVTRDALNSSICRIHMYEPMLGIPGYAAYRTHSNPTLTAYRTMLKEAGTKLGFPDLGEVVDIEQLVYKYLSPEGAMDDPSKSHFTHTLKSFTKEYPSIPLTSMLESWGCSSSVIHSTTYVITNPRYMTAFDRMCRTFELDAFQLWLQAYALLSLINFLPFHSIAFTFYGKFLQGKTKDAPDQEFAMGVLQRTMPQLLGKLLHDHTPHVHKIKEKSAHIVRRLNQAAVNRINAVEWLSPTTKMMAVKKIKKIRVHLAYPTAWRDVHVSLHPSNLLENIIALGEDDTKLCISRLGRACSKVGHTWDDGIFIVNAFYYADQNRMVIPLGMLQPPFFDLKKSIGWNYGGIGCAIAHQGARPLRGRVHAVYHDVRA